MSDEFDDALERLVAPAAFARDRSRVLVPRLISRLYASADDSLRARLLACLVRPLGPLGLAAIAAGAFSGLLPSIGAPGMQVAVDDAARYSSEQVAELARFVAQVSPQALQQFAVLVAESPISTAAFTAAASLLLMHWLGLSATTSKRRPAFDGARADSAEHRPANVMSA